MLAEYRKAPDVTRERLYLETMTQVFGSTSKVLVDVDKGNSLIYLPLEQLMKKNAGKATESTRQGGTSRAPASAGADDGGSGNSSSRSLYSTQNQGLR